jgi:hypothetical protein
MYQQGKLDIFESGVAIAKAVWRSVAEIEAAFPPPNVAGSGSEVSVKRT